MLDLALFGRSMASGACGKLRLTEPLLSVLVNDTLPRVLVTPGA
jgi:hypothetical protein